MRIWYSTTYCLRNVEMMRLRDIHLFIHTIFSILFISVGLEMRESFAHFFLPSVSASIVGAVCRCVVGLPNNRARQRNRPNIAIFTEETLFEWPCKDTYHWIIDVSCRNKYFCEWMHTLRASHEKNRWSKNIQPLVIGCVVSKRQFSFPEVRLNDAHATPLP